MSNHDFGRLATRFGAENARAAALLLLTLPGPGVPLPGRRDRPAGRAAGESRFDRAGRDRYRHPMQWDGSPGGGFTTGEPWLPVVDPADRNVADQRDDPGSTLTLVRELIRLRRELSGELELIDAAAGVLAFRRGRHVVAVNTSAEAAPAPAGGEPLARTWLEAQRRGELAAHAGAIWVGG